MKTALTAWHRVGNLVRLMPPAKAEKVRAAWRQKFRRVCRPGRLIRMALWGETKVSSRLPGRGARQGAGCGAASAVQAVLRPAGTGLEASGGRGQAGNSTPGRPGWGWMDGLAVHSSLWPRVLGVKSPWDAGPGHGGWAWVLYLVGLAQSQLEGRWQRWAEKGAELQGSCGEASACPPGSSGLGLVWGLSQLRVRDQSPSSSTAQYEMWMPPRSSQTSAP